MFQKYDYDFVQAVRNEFAKMGLVAIILDVEDVYHTAPELTEEEAWQVLRRAEEDYDAEYGICWDTLGDTAVRMFPEVLK